MFGRIVGSIFAWLLTLVYFMVVLPIFMVLQGLITPIEIIISCIRNKRVIKPAEYWRAFADNMIKAFELWYDVLDEDY